MRVAILADIHGNLPALEAALAEVERLKVDRLLVAGDVVNGSPDSAACWARIKALGCPVVRGNHERYVADFDTERAALVWRSPQFAPLHYTLRTLSAEQRQELAALPLVWRSEDVPELLMVHSSQRSDADMIVAHTAEAELASMFPEPKARLVVRGHNHACAVREWEGRRIVTCGAVGLPLDGELGAQFTLLTRRHGDWKIEHRLVRYDVDAAVRRFHESGYLEQTGPIGWLFMREVATATFQIMPFLRFYERRQAAGACSLEQGLREFLGTA